MRFRRFLAFFFLALPLLLACKRKPSVPADVIARVGDRMILLSDFKRYVERDAATDLAQVTPAAASGLLDQYLDEVILAEFAVLRGGDVPADRVAAAVRRDPGSTIVEKRDELRRQKIISELDLPEITDSQLRQYYDQHPQEFKTGEEVHVRSILVHDEATAKDIERRLAAGERFEDLSAHFSVAANKDHGGDVGYVGRGMLPKLFEDQIFSMKSGTVSPIMGSDSSFYLFRVDDHRPAGTVDFTTAAPVIRKQFQDEELRKGMADVIAKARKEIPVAVLPRRLPFPYSGGLPHSDNE